MVKDPMITINVSNETWKMIKDRKQKPSHTFDEIIREALLKVAEVEETV